MSAESAVKNQEEKPEPKKEMKHGKDDFEMGQLLGGGSFAKVVEGTIINKESPQYGNKYAVKVMDKRHIMKNNKIKYVQIEKKVFLDTSTHPFICHLHFTFQDSYSLFMVLDLCNDAELSYQIWKYCGLTEELTQFYLSEIISCLEHMHSKKIYHRDIKPENILLHPDGHIRLTDFGTAKIGDNNEEEEKQKKGSFVGTAQYVPPELLGKDVPMSFAGMDFWALGILIYQCLLNKTPFNAANEYLTFKKIEEHNYEMPDSLSENAKGVINGFLMQDFKKRLGMNGYDEIKQHGFFKNVTSWDWEEMKKVDCPEYPPVPKDSPVHDEEKRRELRAESNYEDIGGGNNQEEKPPKKEKLEKKDSNMSLEKWQKFLNKDEQIEMGSTVEKSVYFGMGSQKSVLLLTSMRRVLLIDPVKMQLRKNGDIPRSSIVSCVVIDKETFELRFVKNKMKFKCSGPKADNWKKAFDKLC